MEWFFWEARWYFMTRADIIMMPANFVYYAYGPLIKIARMKMSPGCRERERKLVVAVRRVRGREP